VALIQQGAERIL